MCWSEEGAPDAPRQAHGRTREPARWLNLQAHPEVTVDTVDGPRQVTARAAQGAEGERLWDRWRQLDKDLDAYAARRSMETAVVVFEPRLQA